MATVSDFAEDFASRARTGKRTTVRVDKRHAELFLGVLAREGFAFARQCLDEIHDPEIKRIIETLFFSTAAGIGLGAAVGGTLGGLPGAKVGAVIGAAAGFAAGVVAIVLTAREEGNELVLTANATAA